MGHRRFAREWVAVLYPDMGDDPREAEDFVSFMRYLGGPGDAADWARTTRDLDIRELLPRVRVPTVVIHRVGDRATSIEHGRYLAAHIPGAAMVELPGDAHMWDAGDDITAEVERFVSRLRHEEVELDRYLATVLFTDIVDSTARRRRPTIARGVRRSNGTTTCARRAGPLPGTEMDTAGDGFFATFDGPARAVRCALAITQEVGDLSSRSVRECTRVRCRPWTARPRASRSRSAPGSRRWPAPPRCSCRRRSVTSSPGRGCCSTTPASGS